MQRKSKRDFAGSQPVSAASDAFDFTTSTHAPGIAFEALVPRYDVDVFLDPERHRIEVSGTAALPPATSPRDTVSFLLRTDLGQPRIAVLEPQSCIGEVRLHQTGVDLKLGSTQKWEGRLRATCPPDTPLVVSVAYEGGNEAGLWLRLSTEFSFSSSYSSAWFPTFGYRRGTGTFRYSVPKEIVVKATGRLTSVDKRDERSVYVFAADGPSVFDFVAGPFTVQRREGQIPIALFHLQSVPQAEEILESTAQIVSILEEEFGPYHFGEVAIVEAPMEPSMAAGFEGSAQQGFFLLRSDFLNVENFEMWVVGHELTHFWFPFVVGHSEGTGGTGMLDEALAHYGALRVLEALSGPAAAERFRRDSGQEAIRLTAAYDHRLGGMPTVEKWDAVGYQLSNTKGYLVYDLLARMIGRDRLRAALHRVTREQAGRDIGWGDFWASIQSDAGQPLDWFYEQWLDRASIPMLSLEWSQTDSGLNCVVTQAAPFFRLTVPLQIEYFDGSTFMHEAHLEGETSETEIPTDQVVRAVRLDPLFTTFHATPEQWAEAEARRFVTRGKILWDQEGPDPGLAMFREGLEHVPETDPHGIEFLLRLHIGWIHQENGQIDEALAEYELALVEAVRPTDYLARLYVNLATIARKQGDQERMAWAAQNVLKAERALGKETVASKQAQEMLASLAP